MQITDGYSRYIDGSRPGMSGGQGKKEDRQSAGKRPIGGCNEARCHTASLGDV